MNMPLETMEITHMQGPTLNHVEILTQQGIAALQSNDKIRAHQMLGQVVQLVPHHEQAWLWLSGAVATDAERRYCLEQVLVINPRNSAAQRGMALLPATIPVSPFQEEPPARPEPPSALEIAGAPEPLAASAPLGMATTTAIAASSLLELIAEPEPALAPSSAAGGFAAGLPGTELKSSFFADAAEPPVVTFAPPPIAAQVGMAQPGALTSTNHDQAIVDFVVREFGRHRSRDEIIRTLSQEHRLAWGEAQELMAKVERQHRTTIARRQSPFFIFLGVATLIGGLLLAGRGILVLYALYFGATHGSVRVVNPQAVGIIIAQMFTGIAMIAGSILGLGQTIKGMFK
jgi:hypothetical protein